jgi:hypothetical protein
VNAWYLDTSAFVKLVVEERESESLVRWVGARDETEALVSCDLLRAEARRSAGRDPDPEVFARVIAQLETMTLLPVRSAAFDDAGILDPPDLRTLDAIHLAVAQSLVPDLRGIVTYDRRLAGAATEHGMAVVSPGAA